MSSPSDVSIYRKGFIAGAARGSHTKGLRSLSDPAARLLCEIQQRTSSNPCPGTCSSMCLSLSLLMIAPAHMLCVTEELLPPWVPVSPWGGCCSLNTEPLGWGHRMLSPVPKASHVFPLLGKLWEERLQLLSEVCPLIGAVRVPNEGFCYEEKGFSGM